MRNYTKEEIADIVTKSYEKIDVGASIQKYIEEIGKNRSGKSYNDLLLEVLASMYVDCQRSCCDIITETLNTILND